MVTRKRELECGGLDGRTASVGCAAKAMRRWKGVAAEGVDLILHGSIE